MTGSRGRYMRMTLNRIISEKDIDKTKEVCYTYDSNGMGGETENGIGEMFGFEKSDVFSG